jgi:predicted small lipoprotein YifL
VCHGEAGLRRDDDPATVDYLREQAPYSQYNGHSLRRDPCSIDNTLQHGNRMTICSWRTQSPEPPEFHPHAKLRNSKARGATTSVLRNRHSALCRRLKFATSILRDDIRSITQICPPDTSLHWTVLLADDPLFRDHRCLQMFRLHESARGSSNVPPNILVHLSQLHKKGTLYLPPRKVAPPNSAKSDGANQMVQNLRPQSQRKHPRPRRHPTRFS